MQITIKSEFADCESGSSQYFFLVGDNTIKKYPTWYFKEYNVRS